MDSLFSESDCDSFSESSEEMGFLFGGQALNLLSNLEESIGKIDEFLSYERGFLLGDIVCSVKDPSGQLGRVINCDMLVDLESIHGKVIKDVNSKKLIKIHSISVGDYVVYGHWLGRVDKVIDSISVLFDDGTKCDFTGVDLGKIVPTSPSALDDSQYPFYPGQRVRVQGPMASRSARWLCNSWKKVNQEQGTVCSIKAGFLYVDWLGSFLMGFDLPLQQPPNFQQAKNVTLLSCFSHANWQLGDWCMLQVTDHKNNRSRSERLDKCFHSWDVDLNSKEVFVIARTKTKVDVVWQDGSHSLAVDSQSLLPFNIVDSHEFWPEQFVLEKSGSDDSHAPISHKWGFVQGMDAKEKTVRVLWRSVCMGEGIEFGQEQVEETVSAYELIEHPDYSFCLGEVVFRLIQNESILQAAKDLLKDKAPGADEANFEHDKFERDHNDSLNAFYLSYIGSVVGFKDGMVEVKWANDLTTKVAPHEILRCDKHDGLSASPVPVNANVEQISQQIVHTPLSQKETDTPICWSDEEECIKNSQGDSCFSLPLNAMQFLTSIAVRLFGSFGSEPMLGSEHAPIPQDENGCPASHENAAEICNPGSETQSMVENDSKESELTSLREETEGIQDKDLISKGSERFKQFDMVSDCSDHHFLDGAGKGLVSSSQVKRSWLKKVQQEWSILETNLPDSIYVRIYEERIDLLRAAIIGPPGTPYHDGLFFFDIFLPPEYPNEPPMVHYHSGGLRVNPNLYESGKVCLSLLNTWTGSGSEVWNPGNSTILQVLVSLQALVLNNKPYFNEAGYDKQIGKTEGERNSVSYNENAFLMTCKSMLYLLRKPPKHFEALVDEHFSNRCHGILLSCKEYMKGAPVGFAFGRGQMETENPKGSSTGFKIMLGKLFAKLVEALEDKGIDCRQLLSP